MSINDIPSIYKHAVLQVFVKEKTIMQHRPGERFRRALLICWAALDRQGYLATGSYNEEYREFTLDEFLPELSKVMLSSKGSVRERHHKREPAVKDELFNQMLQTFSANPRAAIAGSIKSKLEYLARRAEIAKAQKMHRKRREAYLKKKREENKKVRKKKGVKKAKRAQRAKRPRRR